MNRETFTEFVNGDPNGPLDEGIGDGGQVDLPGHGRGTPAGFECLKKNIRLLKNEQDFNWMRLGQDEKSPNAK